MKRSRMAAPVLVGLLCLTGCGGSSSSSATPTSRTYQPSAAKVAPCAHAGKPIPLPAHFPTQFPFPSGTDLDRSGRTRVVGQIAVYGFVPSGSFKSTVDFFKIEVPKRGFKLVDFEVDAPNDSEGVYQGHGYVGKWQLRSLPGCHRAMSFAASAQPTKGK